jgi:SNF2 family DNA or RNA helicase
MTALRAFAELNEPGDRIEVFFPYSPAATEAIRAIPGRRFLPNATPKRWTIPLTLEAGQRLREEFGQGLQLGDALRAWGREEVRRQNSLRSLHEADDAELTRVVADRAAWLRPYQRADVRMMAMANVLNANQPGVGKTVEVIYAVEERGVRGLHVVLAPITLHKDPWADELAAHAPDALVFRGDSPAARRKAMAEALAAHAADRSRDVWLILNPDIIRAECDKRAKQLQDESLRGVQGSVIELDRLITARYADRLLLSKDHKGNGYYAKPDVEALFKVDIATLVLDEFHKHGLGEDRNTLFARAALALGKNAGRRFALSGTPMGGKTIRLWGVLHFIEPETYGSKWRWAETWLKIDDDGFGKKIGELIPGREEAFYAAHAKHMVRRTRKEALPGLPDKVIIDKLVTMTPKQRKAYDAFSTMSEALVEGGRVSASGILAEFARLKQFANALCEVRDGDVVPTRESGKLPMILELLDEHGVRKSASGLDPEGGARVIVASESKRMAKMVAEVLGEEGLNVKLLTGEVTGKKRDAVIDWYKDVDGPTGSKEARVLVMTTETGGVGLNLGMTGAIIILDETWTPDDQQQLEDRGMRNRTTPLIVYYLRTKETIQEYIWEVNEFKAVTNKNVVDLRSKILPKLRKEAA